MQLLIPTAKIISEELQTIGKLPAVIFPINKRIVFDYLYEQYETICSSIDIICFENAEKVHRRLEPYKSNKIHIQDLPELGDLAKTIYFGLHDENEPVVINFSDTIVFENIIDAGEDSFFYYEDYCSETWTFYRMKEGMISEILDKTSIPEIQEAKEKLFVGVFYFSDSSCFKKCLKQAMEKPQKNISSFYQALLLYNQTHMLKEIKTENWFDIGHAEKYYNSKLEVKAREFNHIIIDKDRGILQKTSDNVDKFIGEIKWYLKLPADIEYVRPRIFDYSLAYNNPYVKMEYYAYHTIHELFLYGDLNYHQWVEVFRKIRFICDDFRRYTVSDEHIMQSLEDMYLTKTCERLEKLKEDKRFKNFFETQIIVNEKKYKDLSNISSVLKKVIPNLLYDVQYFNIIHGDLCFANMMVDSNFSFIKVIDPRGKFGSFDIYGDFRYELAKLFHSVDGKYDFIIKDLFSLTFDSLNNKIDFTIKDRKRDFDLYQVFCFVFRDEIGNDKAKIELIEALLFLSMIPLHNESFDHQLVMLGTGLEILNRVVNIEIDAEEQNV